MASIQTAIELYDGLTAPMMNIINAVNMGVSSMYEMNEAMNNPIDTASFNTARDNIARAEIAVREFDDAIQKINGSNVEINVPSVSAPVEVPFKWQSYNNLEVFTNTGVERFEQELASVNSMLEQLNDDQFKITMASNDTDILSPDAAYDIRSVEGRVQSLIDMIRQVEETSLDVGTDDTNANLERLRGALFETINLENRLKESMQGADLSEVNSAFMKLSENITHTEMLVRDTFSEIEIPPVEIPITWQSDNLEVFTNTGVDRFQQEIRSANNMLNTLNSAQQQISATAAQTSLFPANAVADMNTMQNRLQAIQQKIQTIESNPLNIGSDTANAELERLRGQLSQAVSQQEDLNRAVENMDIEGANQAYLHLSQTIGNTERYIRDNVNEQGRFNRELEEGANAAGDLMQMVKGAVAAYTGIAGIRKAFSFVQDCTELFNTQLNAENQLMVVLGNMLDKDYVSQFTIETTADTTAAVNEINAIQNSVDEVVVPISAESKALVAAFDQITEKASEIQSRGIYGDEAMIAAAAEFSTYFSDTNAIEMMMDTLSDYAMGMSGGGEVGSQQMVDYATNLGKIMSGAYDAMTKKGFELSDTQKAIIEGTATQEQIVSALGEEYLAMSQDMQAAAAISQVVEESWAGLYESMSKTPKGKIIQMTNAWGDMKEVIGRQLYPYVLLFVDAITENWSTIEGVVQGITTGLEFLLGVLSLVLEAAISVADAIIENWSWISPIIYGVAGALAVYYGWQLAVNTISAISKGIKIALCVASYAHAAATGAEVSATAAATAAQYGLNTAMYACPIVWIIILIIALIALFYAAVAAINKFAGTSISATGIICGAFMVAIAFIGNRIVTLINFIIDGFARTWNFIAAFVNFFGNAFNDPIGSIVRLFRDLVDNVLSLLETLASAIDTIFGSNLAGSVQGWRDSLGGWVDDTFGKGEEIMAKINAQDWHLDRFEYKSAWDKGYEFGKGIDESIANFDPSSLFGTTDIPSPEDYANNFIGIDDIGSSVDNIAGNTSDIADAMDITEEDLKYLRDIAEKETINRFTTAEIKIEQTNNNTISSDWDLDGVVDGLTDAVDEAVNIIAEGVHV